MSFWGATVSAAKPFEESVPTNANLIVSHVSLAGATEGITTLMCTVEGTDGDFVVAHLSWNRNEQASVDLVYPLGTDVKFTVKGKGEVHLLGMYDPVEDMNMGYGSSDDEEGMMFGSEDSDLEGEDDEEDSDEALRMQYGTARGPKITELAEGSDDEDSEDEGVAVPVQQPKKQPQQQGQKQGGQQQKQGGQQQGQKQGGQQQGQKQGGQQQKQGGQQQGQKQGGQQQGGNNNQGQKRKNPQDAPNQPQQKKQKTQAAKELTANNRKNDNKDKSNIIKLKCHPCDQMFASKASLDQHQRSKHPKRK